jgi:hypothetical protein
MNVSIGYVSRTPERDTNITMDGTVTLPNGALFAWTLRLDMAYRDENGLRPTEEEATQLEAVTKAVTAWALTQDIKPIDNNIHTVTIQAPGPA